jgi:hypothetical protein
VSLGVKSVAARGRESEESVSANTDEVVMPPPGRSSMEIREILSKLKLMAEAYSPYPDLKVVVGRGVGWSCGLGHEAKEYMDRALKDEIQVSEIPRDVLRPKVINADLNDITTWPERRIIGVQTHEIGHAKHTDYRLFLEGQVSAFKEGHLPSSWAGLWNALEDPWINNREMQSSDPRRAAMEELYAHWVEKHQSGVERAALLNQLGLNAIHYWATGKNIPTITDKRVLEAWEKIKSASERYFTGASSQENHEVFQREVWPIARELEKQSKEDSLLDDLKRRLTGNQGPQQGEGEGQGESQGQPKGSSQSGQPSGSPSGSQSSGVQNGGKQTSSSQGGAPSGQSQEKKGLFDRIKDKVFGNKEERANKDLTERVKDAAEKAGGFSPDDGKQGPPSDGSTLTDDERKQLQEIVSQLDPKTREELQKIAEEAIDKAQSDFQNETFNSPLPLKKDPKDGVFKPTAPKDPKPKSDSESKSVDEAVKELEEELEKVQAQEDAEAARQNAERAEQLAQEIRKREMEAEGFDPNQADDHALYDQYKELERSTAGYVKPFIDSLRPLLPKNRALSFQGHHYSGPKIDFREVARRVPVKDYQIHQRPVVVESPQPRMYIELLIDNSGSMAGEKMHETMRSAIFWGRVLKTFEIPFAIKLFGTGVITIKDFDQEFDDPRQRIKPRLMRLATASMGGTDIGEPLMKAHEEMFEERRRHKSSLGAIFVLSDSGANQGLTGSSLKAKVDEVREHFVVSNFILTKSPGEIREAKSIFGDEHVVAPSDFKELCPETVRVLRGTLDGFRKRLKL